MNENRAREIMAFAARFAALLVTIGVSVLAVYWLIVGHKWTGITSQGYAGVPPTPFVTYEPYPPAVMYLVAAVLLVVGLVRLRWLPMAWLGLALLFTWSLLFLFSSGAEVLPAAAALLILLTVLQTRRLALVWMALLILLAVAIKLNYPLATALLIATGFVLGLLEQINSTEQFTSAGWGRARYEAEAQQVTVSGSTGYLVQQLGWWILDWKIGTVGFELRAPVGAVARDELLQMANGIQS